MKRISVSLLCVLLVGFISCQKEVSEELPQNADTADTLLSGILVGDTVNPGINMTLWEFVYDNDKRVTEIRNTYFDSANGQLTIHEQFSTYFYYNGSERNPFKSFGWTRFLVMEWEVFHYYDAQGRLARDSMGAPDNSHMLNVYEYLPGKVRLTSSLYDTGGTMTDQFPDSFTVAGNNISNAYVFFALPIGNQDAFAYSYDDKINPLSKMNIASCLGLEGLTAMDKFVNLSFGYSKNNIIRRVGTSSTNPAMNIVQDYEFTYNNNNLPLTGKFKQNGSDDEGIRIFFQYTH